MRLGFGLDLAILAASQYNGGTRTPAPSVLQLAPGDSWNGTTTWAGRTVPTESGIPNGTFLQDAKPTGNFAEVQYRWVSGSGDTATLILIPLQSGDIATDGWNYAKQVTWWYEGRTAVSTEYQINTTPRLMPDGTMAPQGSICFMVELLPGTGAGGNPTAGDAELYATMEMENGLPRVVKFAHINNVDRSLDEIPLQFTADLSAASSGTLVAPYTGIPNGQTKTELIWFVQTATGGYFSRVGTLTGGSATVSWTGGTVTANKYAYFCRPVIYVDNSIGSNSNLGNTAATPWLDVFGGLGSGSNYKFRNRMKIIVMEGTGFYNTFTGGGSVQLNTQMVEIVLGPGLIPGDVIFSAASRPFTWGIGCNRYHVQGIQFDMNKITGFNGGGANYTIGFSACRFVDPYGANGPQDANGFDIGYNIAIAPVDSTSITFQGGDSATGKAYVTESYIDTLIWVGPWVNRNVSGRYAVDCIATGGGSSFATAYSNTVHDGLRMYMLRAFKQRNMLENDAPVGTITYDSGTNRTTIALSGTPTIQDTSGPAGTDKFVQFVTGAGATANNEWGLYSSANSTKTIDIKGNAIAAGVVVGDSLRLFQYWHSDNLQNSGVTSATQPSIRNLAVIRSMWDQYNSQMFLTAPTAGGFSATVRVTTQAGDGCDMLIDSSQTWTDGDCLELTSGPQAGEWRYIVAVTTGSVTGTTFRINEPWSVAQVNQIITRTKTTRGIGYACNINRKRDFTGTGVSLLGDEIGQLNGPLRDFTILNSTFIGRQSGGNLNTLTIRERKIRNFCFGTSLTSEAFTFDSIAAFPTVGGSWPRNQYGSGTNRSPSSGTKAGTVAAWTYDSDFVADSSVLRHTERPVIPFDCYGNPISIGDRLGGAVGPPP